MEACPASRTRLHAMGFGGISQVRPRHETERGETAGQVRDHATSVEAGGSTFNGTAVPHHAALSWDGGGVAGTAADDGPRERFGLGVGDSDMRARLVPRFGVSLAAGGEGSGAGTKVSPSPPGGVQSIFAPIARRQTAI
jgi:hypothetical protein